MRCCSSPAPTDRPQDPLNFQVGYYTAVAGLGASPNDVVINGSVDVRNQCDVNGCTALNNFWRSLSNLTINVTNPDFGCYTGEFWAVSQAAPMRRVHVNGQTTLMDYCTQPSFASGGFIADSQFDNGTVINGSQQQWVVRNSQLDGWTNGVWNQVFSGVVGAPAQCFPAIPNVCGPYTTLPTSPVTREAPYLYVNSAGDYRVFVPSVRRNSSGTSWGSGPTAGTSIPIDQFFIATPSSGAQAINNALSRGQEPDLHAGCLRHRQDDQGEARRHRRARARLPDARAARRDRRDDRSATSPESMCPASSSMPARSTRRCCCRSARRTPTRVTPNAPTALHDVFFRIGGAAAGKATVSLEVNSDNVILDDIWAWRADHGNGVGWTVNTADTGVVVNGNDVTAYGLFVEHYQRYEVIWNGERGTVVFFQNEMPYDPPNQAAWMEAPGVDGWAAFKVADSVQSFSGYGMGSYSFFNQGVDIFAAHAFEVPTTLPAGSLHDLLTIFLDASVGKGGILNVVNDTGGPSTIANPDTPVTVVSYP